MERKTMGAFIAVLRKSSGMTQKQLAEMLLVSDKTISHWERDESVPDISLIPVIAEIFSVSCDELIKGERKPLNQNEESCSFSPKKEKQLKYMLDKKLTKFKTQALISLCITLAGFAFALFAYCSFAWNAFYANLIFTFVSLFCLIIFHILYIQNLSAEDFEENSLSPYIEKERIFFYFTLTAIFAVQSITLSEILNYSLSPLGLFNSLGVIIFALILMKITGTYDFTNRIKEKLGKTSYKVLKLRLISVFVAVVLIFSGHCGIANLKNHIYSKTEVTTTFTDVTEFIRYMETEAPLPEKYAPDSFTQREDAVRDKDGFIVENVCYYTENSEEIIVEFTWRNRAVADYSVNTYYDGAEYEVTTYEALYNRNQQINRLNYLYGFIPLVLIGTVWVYNKKKKVI